MTKQRLFLPFAIIVGLTFTGCTRHQVEVKPVEVKPIHITIDVNVKIDEELNDFFGELDKAAEEAVEGQK